MIMRKITLFLLSLVFCAMAFDASAQGKIYLAGPFNFYGFMGSFSEKWEMTSEDGIVYKGTFNIPADKLIFNITDYTDEDHYKIFGSSAREGNRVYFDFTETDGLYSAEMQYGGSGDWAYEEWPGGEVSFSIDFGSALPVVSIFTSVNPDPENGENGVETIGVEDRISPVYNLQGVKVQQQPLAPGLYISNGKKFIKH